MPSEKQIEAKVCEYARRKGCMALKFSSPGRVNVPDRIFLGPGGKTLFIEFKAPGKKPTEGQVREITRLQELDFSVFWTDSEDRGKELIDLWMEGSI